MDSRQPRHIQIGILASQGSWYLRELERAAARQGCGVSRLSFPRLRAGTLDADSILLGDEARDLTQLHAVIVRTMPPGSLEQVVYRMDVLSRLEAHGVVVVNPPKSIEHAVDKYLTTARLHAQGIPVPDTLVCEDADDAMDGFEKLGGDVVVKPLFGSEGRGIVRVSDPDLAFRTFRTLSRTQSVLYLQRFVEHAGFDVRVLVLGRRIVGAIRRHADGDFRTNVSRRAAAVVHEITDTERDLSLRAASATLAEFAGVDILYDNNNCPLVIEINAVPGWRAFRRVTGIDVAGQLIEHVSHRSSRQVTPEPATP